MTPAEIILGCVLFYILQLFVWIWRMRATRHDVRQDAGELNEDSAQCDHKADIYAA
jgi:uncharacterized membrane protein YqjE